MAPTLDPILTALACQAPTIQGNAKLLIAFLKNPSAPGANMLSADQRQSALASIQNIDENNPESLKLLQDELDKVCRK